MSNPLVDIHGAFWSMLTDHAEFAADVPAGSKRVNYVGGGRSPEKDEVSPADLPEVRIKLDKVNWRSFADSANTGITFGITIEVATGNQDATTLFDVIWAVGKASMDWETRMDALTWESKTFVRACRVLGAELTLDDKELNRGIRGWATAWRGEVDCWFDTTDLKDN